MYVASGESRIVTMLLWPSGPALFCLIRYVSCDFIVGKSFFHCLVHTLFIHSSISRDVLLFSAVAESKCADNHTCTFGRGTCTPIWLNATYGTHNCACKSQYKGVNCEHGNTLTCLLVHFRHTFQVYYLPFAVSN